jgi:hypothetical protein
MLIGIGAAFIIFGFIFCLTIIGAFIGVPMMIVGLILCIFGAVRRKTVINNIVTVSSSSGSVSGNDR